ncbi:hypothetical protein E4U36_000524 [Claviceps purpurea]|nr:hypothetical protein E4U36_000524 [Claviceps purpurea]
MRHLMQENLSKDLATASISRRMESNMTQRDLVGSVLRTNFQVRIPSPDYLFTIQVLISRTRRTTDWGKTLAVLFALDSNGG